MIARVLAAAVALAALGTGWTGLYAGVGLGHLAALISLGAAPALLRALGRGGRLLALAGVLVAAPLALALALRVAPAALIDGATRARLADLPGDARAAGGEAIHPVVVAEAPALVAALDLALVALAALIAWQLIVGRRPLMAVLPVVAALAYVWTVAAPARPERAGVLVLGALVLVLALAARGGAGGRRRPLAGMGGAAVVGVGAVALAGVLGAGAAAGEPGWWDWRDWGTRPAASAGPGALDIRQTYAPLAYDAPAREVVRVTSARRLPLRAAALESFDGVAFRPQPGAPARALAAGEGGEIRLPDPPLRGERVRQRVHLVGGRSPVLLAGGRPIALTADLDGREARLVADAVRVEPALLAGARHEVLTTVPRVTPAALAAIPGYAGAAVPRGATDLRAGPSAAALATPAMGQPGASPPDAALGPYSEVRRLAREVTAGAESPYAAVNRVESHLRSGYAYDERPPAGPSGEAPLVTFLFRSRAGFCQQFAGSMAVMLRILGIPSRVVVGYTGGVLDSARGEWVVSDRDAHSWVEVWFPGLGWLPFDPTPGRAAANPASVSSPEYAPPPRDAERAGIEAAAVAAPPPPPAAPPAPQPAPEAAAPGGRLTLPPAPRLGPAGLAGLGLLGVAALAGPPAAKALRRARRRGRGDERARVLGALRELEGALADLGHPTAAAHSAGERAAALRARLGVDAGALYRRAGAARYAPGRPPPGAAAATWTELGRVRRDLRRRVPLGRRLLAPWHPASLARARATVPGDERRLRGLPSRP